jgi:biopolymer transport protein ExbD
MEHILPPKDDTDEAIEPDEAIYIKIFPSGQFEMDGTSYSIDQVDKVYEYVDGKVQVNAKKPIIVHTNREAQYGDMVQVLNQLKLLSVHMKQELAITIPSKEEAKRYTDYN